MIVEYNDYMIEVINDLNYILNSADNIASYKTEYFDGASSSDRFYPTSKHGIRVKKDGKDFASTIICEFTASTTIHTRSFIISSNTLLICCSDHVILLDYPHLLSIGKRDLIRPHVSQYIHLKMILSFTENF
jgi:hypothetical protein